jgi:DNA-binding CsgD family transcriptional regulator
MYLGELLVARGMPSGGVEHLRAAFTTFVGANLLAQVAWTLEVLAEAALPGHPAVAVRLLGAEDALPETDNRGVPDNVAQSLARIMESARSRLGEPAFAIAWDEGTRLSLDELRAEVETLAESMTISSAADPAPVDTHGLTPRELEVLQLVADGMSNREIATALYISLPTVKRHITTILGKLNLPSRTAATAYAHTHALLHPGTFTVE